MKGDPFPRAIFTSLHGFSPDGDVTNYQSQCGLRRVKAPRQSDARRLEQLIGALHPWGTAKINAADENKRRESILRATLVQRGCRCWEGVGSALGMLRDGGKR